MFGWREKRMEHERWEFSLFSFVFSAPKRSFKLRLYFCENVVLYPILSEKFESKLIVLLFLFIYNDNCLPCAWIIVRVLISLIFLHFLIYQMALKLIGLLDLSFSFFIFLFLKSNVNHGFIMRSTSYIYIYIYIILFCFFIGLWVVGSWEKLVYR